MSKEKQNEEILELSSIIGCAVNDWCDFCEDCHKDGYSPTDTLEEYVAVSVLTKGYRKQSGWISVEERLPDNNTERVLVLLADDDFTKPIGENKIDTDRFVDGKWVRWWRFVTHWMPLPEPPKGV